MSHYHRKDEITRDEARALIAKHGIVALEREIGRRQDGSTYELDHNQYFRLGNGRLLWRQDSSDQDCESWELVVDEIEAAARDATHEPVDMSIEAATALQEEANHLRAERRDLALRFLGA